METTECGAACLKIVMGHFGRHIAMEQLRRDCGISRDGTNAAKLVQAAHTHGLIAKGFRMETVRLQDTPMPVVVFWNFNHFVVVEGFKGRRVLINDPAQGRRSVDLETFEEAFTGIVLAFQPGAEFETTSRPPSAMAALASRLSGSLGAFAVLLAAGLALVVIGILTATFTRVFVDQILIEGQQRWLWPLIAAMAAAAMLQFLLTWLQLNQSTRLRTKLATLWASGLTWRMLRLPMTFFGQRSPGDLANRVTLADRAASLVGRDLALAVVNVVSVGLIVAVMLQYDLVLTVVGVGFAGVNLLAFASAGRALRDAHQRLQFEKAKADAMVMQGLRMIESFKATGTEDVFFNRWLGYYAHTIGAEQSVGRIRLLVMLLPAFFGTITVAAILVVGGAQVMSGALSIGMLVAFQTLMQLFLSPMERLIGVGTRMQEAQSVLLRIQDILAQPEDPEFDRTSTENRTETKVSGQVKLKGVTFGYNPLDPAILDAVSLDLPLGRRIAVVGGSGSGKSTLGRLIAGLVEPWAGNYMLDGVEVSDLSRTLLRQSVAMVDQDVTIFEGTIHENITMWDDSLPEDWVVRAAKDACLHEEIADRSDGYRHVLLEGGANLSGGQKQRLEIARALVGNPSLLVLDEATSALDAETERRVIENLRTRGCSMVIIAHRVSAIRDADEIVVLQKGKVVQQGNFDELIANAGPFRTLMAKDSPPPARPAVPRKKSA